jgi:hypothetical protein
MVDNQQLRLAQGLDGNWYGYFADSTDVATLVAVTGDQLGWGTSGDPLGANGISTFDTQTYRAIPTQSEDGTVGGTAGAGVIDNPPVLSNWNNTGNAACTA